MVNTANQIDAELISQHPLAGGEMDVLHVMVGEKAFLAVMAIVGGVIRSRKGTERFNAGDYIVSDDPPTNAWKVNPEAFRSTYRKVDEERPPHTVPSPAAPDLAARAADKTISDKQKAARAAAKPKTRGPGPKMRMPGQRAETHRTAKRKGAIKAPPK
jgi:hypothetical protein